MSLYSHRIIIKVYLVQKKTNSFENIMASKFYTVIIGAGGGTGKLLSTPPPHIKLPRYKYLELEIPTLVDGYTRKLT